MNIVPIVTLILSAISIAGTIYLGILQVRTSAKRARSGEALDWSETAKNLRAEIEAQRQELQSLRGDMKDLREENKVLKELARRLIKNPPEKGEVIVLSPVEQALLFDTNPKWKKA